MARNLRVPTNPRRELDRARANRDALTAVFEKIEDALERFELVGDADASPAERIAADVARGIVDDVATRLVEAETDVAHAEQAMVGNGMAVPAA
ncbi:MAG TPA: hypothetical protein VMW08_00470 [Acidimicrobiales bacterium]|nr:hypothetical protein [Acidimicrobiales bacterium]